MTPERSTPASQAAVKATLSGGGAVPFVAGPQRLTLERIFMVVSPLALVALWELLARLGVLDRRFFSSPSAVLTLALELFRQENLGKDLLLTLTRLVSGFLAGVVPGVLLGLTMGVFRVARAIINPFVKIIFPLPRIAFLPLVLIVLGANEGSYTLMVALGPFFIMVVSTMTGVMNVDPIYRRVARSFGVNTLNLYRWVIFPGALPIIFGGLRLSLGMALINTVAVEFLHTNNGIGFLIWNSWQVLSLGRCMVGLTLTGLVGYLIFLLVDLVERWALPWKDPHGQR